MKLVGCVKNSLQTVCHTQRAILGRYRGKCLKLCSDHNRRGITLSGVSASHPRGKQNASFVLGIETSCDDTGAAIVDSERNIIGEALNSQTRFHVQLGGIIPPFARDLHEENIDGVIQDCLAEANMGLEDVSAIAVTVKPGLPLSLCVGLNHAKRLAKEYRKPLIPVHHMEAHALTARITHQVTFPFLVLLVSGGHCLLALAREVDDFLLLGKGIDEAPGDVFDKTARRLKLKNLPQFDGVSGGLAVEMLAKGGNPEAFEFARVIMSHHRHCDFSFSGIRYQAQKVIEDEERTQGTAPYQVIHNAADLCASFQYSVLRHLAQRLQRAFLFCELKGLLTGQKTLVVSGGVASNQFIRSGLEKVCAQYDASIVCPAPKLCTDNGVMIAWNGMEKLVRGIDVTHNLDTMDVEPKCPLGVDITEEVHRAQIKLPRIKLLS